MRIPPWHSLLLVCLLAVAGALPASAADRVALLVGCANYKSDPNLSLDTPLQDVKDLGALLSSPALGFEVIPALDATAEDFHAGLRKFKTRAQGAKVALVFFSGHGIEHDGRNYLLTVNAALDTEDQLETQTMNLDHVMKELGATGALVKLAILDCCRNNPFTRTKSWVKSKSMASDSVLRALGEAEIPQATLVCFATSAGRKAAAVLKDDSRNSPFTELLLEEMARPGLPLRTIFENVHDRVSTATAGRQVPTVKTDNALSDVFRKTILVPVRSEAGAPMVKLAPQATPRPALPPLPPAPLSLPKATPPPGLAPAGSPAAATKDVPFVNSLGMKFVPVPGTKLLFSVWVTRVQDYAVYAKENKVVPEDPKFEQGPTHPVTCVNWHDARAFCSWLSQKEGRKYRLPTDAEWSVAVGLGPEKGSTPDEKHALGVRDVYPWGTQWPPAPNSGNYKDGPVLGGKIKKGTRDDGFLKTSPVGSYAPNPLGLYDMGGNVTQWCEDRYKDTKEDRVVRGGSYFHGGEDNLRSSGRLYEYPGTRFPRFGFRCVLVLE